MSQQKRQNSLGLKKVGFAAIATSILSVAFLATQSLSLQESDSVAAKFEKLQKLNEHNTTVSDVNFSPDGQTLASASYDGTVKLWNVTSGEIMKTLEGHSDKIYSVSFSPDGKTIASASADKTIKIWSRDGSLKKVLQGHDAEVTKVNFCPDNQVIVSGSADNTISLWRVDGNLVRTLSVGDSIRGVVCSSDSKIIAVSSDDNVVRLWSRDGQKLQTYKLDSLGNRGRIYFISDKKDSLIADDDSSKLLIPIITSQPRKEDSLKFRSFSVINYQVKASSNIINPETQAVIKTDTAGQETGGNISIDTKFLTIKDGSVIGTANLAQGNSGNLSIDTKSLILKDGATINTATSVQGTGDISTTFIDVENARTINASIGSDNTIKLLRKDGLLLRTLKHNKPVIAFDFHPNYKILASGCDDGTIYIWDVTTGQLIRHFQAHKSKVSRINYSFDGRKITSVSDDGTVKDWYSDSPNFKVVIIVLAFLISGSTALYIVTKHQQSKQHNKTSNTQSNYIITGWVVCVLPEDWRGDLEALRYELIAAKQPRWYVRLITATTLLDMLFGGIQVKLHNFYYGNNFMAVIGRRSITEDKDNSANHKDLNE